MTGWVAVWLAGCSGGGDPSTTPDPPAEPVCGDAVCEGTENEGTCADDCPRAGGHEGDLTGCTDGLTQGDIDAVVPILQTTEGSYHEMVACGGLAMDLSWSLIGVVLAGIESQTSVELPTGFTYVGDGVYRTEDDTTVMDVVYLYGDDLQAGDEDTVVAYDLFDWDNYLQGMSVDIDVFAQELEVSYTSAGPLVELLGLGPNPDNPFRIGIDDVDTLGGPIGRLKMLADVLVVDPQDDATVDYHLTSDPRRLNPLLENGDFDVVMDYARTDAADGSTLTSTSWGVGYNDSAGVLDGDVGFEIRDGAVDLDGTFTYDMSAWPVSTELHCPE